MDARLMDDVAMPLACRRCSARLDGMCASLSPAELELLSTQTRHTHHQPGEALAIESDVITSYANVTDGVVKLSRVLRDGRQQLVGLQFAPDLMGRLFGTESPLTAEAASAVDLCRVPKLVLETLVAQSSTLKRRLLDQSLQDLDDAREWMVTLGRKTATERVASLLLLIATRISGRGAADGTAVTFELPLGRGDMADFLGLTIETVSRQISKLRNDGIVVVENHRLVRIPDMAALRRRAG